MSENPFTCCGRRMVIMPYSGGWAIGCTFCTSYAEPTPETGFPIPRDIPVFIINDLIEIGGN
jgi:hypothetical protein